MAGAQTRYTVVDRHGASLAMIGMAAAAWKTAPRDHAIGWSPETRARNLHLVVNQSRLLLLPWIVIPTPRIPHPVDAAPTTARRLDATL